MAMIHLGVEVDATKNPRSRVFDHTLKKG